MGVELRGGQGRVAEQFLNDPQIRAALEEMGGCAVPKTVRTDIGRSVDGGDGLVYHGAGLPLIESTAAGTEQ